MEAFDIGKSCFDDGDFDWLQPPQRHRALRSLPIVTHNCDLLRGRRQKGGLQGKTLKR